MTIERKAQPQDIPQLIALRRRQLLDEGMTPCCSIDAALSAFFAAGLADGSYVCWVIEQDGALIATGGVCFYTLPPSFRNPTGLCAYIVSMYTMEPYRRRGLATRLLLRVLDEARARGCAVARLHASAQGRALYEALGFTASQGYMEKRLLPSD